MTKDKEVDNELDVLLHVLPKDPSVAIKLLAQVMLSIIIEYSAQPDHDLANMSLAMRADLHNLIKKKLVH
jgi:hypothetical protein